MYKDLKKYRQTGSFKDLLEDQPEPISLKLQMDSKTKERYLKLKEEILPSKTTSQQFMSTETERLRFKSNSYQNIKSLPVHAVELGKITEEKRKEEKELMKMTTSMKTLTRKKSIKNIKESESVQKRKISKSLKMNTLTKRLPSLGTLYMKM